MSDPFAGLASEQEEATGTDAPAQESATPAESQEATPAEALPVGEVQPAVENEPTAATADEPSVAASETEESSEEETPSVKAQARKVYFDVQKMGGQAAFDAAREQFDAYFNQSPQDYYNVIAKYPAKFYPARDYLLTKVATDFPDDVVDILRTVRPDLDIQIAKKGEQPQQTAPAATAADFDPVADANEVLADEYSTPQEKARARYTLAQAEKLAQAEERLGKLPELEERANRADEFQTQAQARAIETERVKYIDELMEASVDRTYRESGLEGSPISLAKFRKMVSLDYQEDAAANARFLQAMDAIGAGDKHTPALLKEQILRDAERIAFASAREFATAKSQAQDSKTHTLTQARPTVIPSGAPPVAQPQQGKPFDLPRYEAALDDIVARG